MKQQNPFPYSDDNKRYHTWNYYLKHTYGKKLFKVPLDAGFTCPNRDGSKGYGGCTFCGAAGSGECVKYADDLIDQFEYGCAMMKRKWPNADAMAYFQAYTNTYGTLDRLHACFDPFLSRDDVKVICIATRADCLNAEIIHYLTEMNHQKDIWIELGLQSIHDETALLTNRGHDFQTFLDAIDLLKQTNLKICVHLINGFPNENEAMMIETARVVGSLPIHAVKLHMLHIMKGSKLASDYQAHPFPLFTKEQYVDLIVKQLEVIPKEIIIQRLTGDGVSDLLIAPLWTVKKVSVLNDIDKRMAALNTWQGKAFEKQ